MAVPTPAPAVATQVRLRLSTKALDLTLPEDAGVILVPTSFKRYALSTLVNNLLHTDRPTPLEFLINRSYLRTSIDEYLTINGISAETTLEVEYAKARAPPVFVASFDHDDWVSSVDCLSTSRTNGRILTGCYDGFFRVWNASCQLLTTSPQSSEGGHTSWVTAVKFVSPSQIVSGSADRSVRLWKYAEDETGFSASLAPQLELWGHKMWINSVDVHAPSKRILSGSQDKTMALWSTEKEGGPPPREGCLPFTRGKSNKRQKVDPSLSAPRRGPLTIFEGHNDSVSGAIFDFKDNTVAYSSSWDHGIRTWDLVTSALVDTRTADTSLFSIEQMPELHLVAGGSAVLDIYLVDVRDSATRTCAITLKGHKNQINSMSRDPHSEYGLLSGSSDGTCRVWDVRNTKNTKDGTVGRSLYTIPRESLGGKKSHPVEGPGVYGVHWDKDLGILSGGKDKKLQINTGEGVVLSEEKGLLS